MPIEVGGEQRLAVWRPPDAGGAELGACVLDGVVGELRASGLGAGEDLGASRLLPLARSGSTPTPAAAAATRAQRKRTMRLGQPDDREVCLCTGAPGTR